MQNKQQKKKLLTKRYPYTIKYNSKSYSLR